MKLNKSWFVLSSKRNKLKGFDDAYVRFTAELAEKFIKAFSKKGDTIFDPFAGFGTTLISAQKLGRVGIGIEYEEKKVRWVEPQLSAPSKIIHGSSLEIGKMKLPKIDMVFGSPPYMRNFDKVNPLSNYTETGQYQQYLKRMGKIYSQIKKITKKNAPIIIEIENTFDKKHPMTPLAWDVAKEVSKYLYFEREFIQCYKEGNINKPGSNNNHSYLLLFRNR